VTATALVQPLDEWASARPSHASLSVCCLTGGTALPRLAAILRLLRPVADEIVVGVDARARRSADLLGDVADRIVLFTHAEPSDRPIAWLIRQCAGDWVFNIDDDEVPSADLLRELGALPKRTDVTHCWVARRWLHPDLSTFLDQPPWSTEFQLRLFRADDRSLRFTDQFHRPVACSGPARFVEAPLWHLDTALTSREDRERKALRYERARRGMRIGAFSHNTGLYVPELHGELELADVPPRELATIMSVLLAPPVRGRPASVEEPSPLAVDREWPGAPHPAALYDASISLRGPVPPLVGGVQQTIDIRIENRGDCVWRTGEHAITLGTRWDGAEDIRTSLPADVMPGDSAVVPLHVLPPLEPGPHVLEVDLVHEHVRWFGRTLRLDVSVGRRRRVLVVGAPGGLHEALDTIALVPDVEPLLLLEPEEPDLGHQWVAGLGPYLFGPDGLRGASAVRRALWLLAGAKRGHDGPDGARGFIGALRDAECLIVVGDDVRPDAPPTRDRLRTFVMVAAARAHGVPVWRIGAGESQSTGLDQALQRAIRTRVHAIETAALATLLRTPLPAKA
jgi:hypothetical protein